MDDRPRDLTDCQESERSQADSLAMYQAAIETSADGFWLLDAEGRILEVNNAYVKQSGYTREELLTMKVTDLEVIERPEETAAHIANVLHDGNDLFETLHRAKDGTTWQVEINVSYRAIDGGRFFCFLRNITQRKQAESEFLNREQQLQALSANLAEGMVYQINSGPDGQQRQFTYVSPAVETLHGLTVEEVKQDPGLLYGQVIEEDRALVAERELHAFATKTKLEMDVRVRIPSGDIRWRRFISSPRIAPNGCWVWDGIELDITERKRAEQQIRDSEELFRAIYNNIGIGIALIARDMQIRSINPQMQKWFPHIDLSQQHICYQSFNTPSRDSICGYCPTVLTFKDGQVHTAITDTPTPDGVKHYQIVSSPLLAADGSISAAIEMVEDITERTKVEQSLCHTQELFALFVRHSPIYVYIKEVTATESRVLQASENFKEMVGIPGSEMIGRSMSELFPPEFAAKITADDWAVVSGGEVLKLEEELHGRTYTTIKFPIVQGDRTLLAGYTIDITDRKEDEKKILQGREFIQSILDTVDEGFIVIDRDYRILTANKAYCSQVGGCDEKIIGSHCYEVSHKIDRPCFDRGEKCAVRQVFETGRPHTELHRHKDARGNLVYVETKAYPIKDACGAVTSVIETINNITEKYLLEEERLKTQKLESIGTLAGGIAHDFNNLLQGVFGYIVMAKITHDQKEKSLAMLDQAEEALHMSVNLTTQLLTFSKGGKPVKKLMSIESTIENAVKFALSGSHTDYTLEIVPGLWSVEADAGQLAQVIQNIVLNANEAMAGRGTVTIAVKNMDIPSQSDLRLPEGGQFVRIDIQDTGTGISGQNIAKIFDPYFTTKQRGSGLGLATSYSIIKNHGGLIEVESEIDRGTTFSIYLPASKDAKIIAEPAKPAAVSVKMLRVLLMDDEDVVRNVAKEMITALDHEVVGAEDGKKAIELFRQAREAGRPFDLVILDLTVKGGMGGEEAVAKILEIDPHVKVIVSSGYADNPVVADYRAYGFSGVLNKPYRLDALKDCLNLFFS